MRIRFFLFVVLAVAACRGRGEREPEPERPAPPARAWSVFVYMAADAADMEPYASVDLQEMETAAATSSTPVFVNLDLFSRPGGYQFRVGEERIEGPEPEGEPADRLRAFLQKGIENYPARHYALILWGHGRGWRPKGPAAAIDSTERFEGGLMFDASDNTVLDVPSLADVLRGLGIELLIGDACLLETMEIAFELEGAIKYLIGSEQIETYQGLPYDRALPLFRGDDVRAVAAAIPAVHAASAPETLTSAALDLTRIRELAATLDHLARTQLEALDRDPLLAIDHAQAMSAGGIPRFLGGGRDLGLVLKTFNVAVEVPVVANTFGARYRNRGMTGVSVWMPIDRRDFEQRSADFATSRLHRSTALDEWFTRVFATP